jgi:hypothetical protein
LKTVDGISDIQTDISNNLCTFKLKDKDLDIKAKLTEFAKTNTHIAGWSIVERKPG